MRKINPERKAFILKVLFDKSWTTRREGYQSVKTLRLSEIEEIMKDIQIGKTFIATVNGSYIIDGGTAYGFYEYKF